MAASLSGVVVAGGEGRRMGSDKRLFEVDGEPLLRRALAAVAQVADDMLVVESVRSPVPRHLLAGYACRVVQDGWPDGGPLAGIEAGLAAAHAPWAVVVAADAPWLEPAMLRLLAAELGAAPDTDAVVIVSERGPEPLLGAYRSGVSRVARSLLERGERRMGALLDEVSMRPVDPSVWRKVDPEGRSLVNLNEPDDL